ncbi:MULTISPECIES: hypothetical protein [unclassified Leisingera]|nr:MULTISPECIES: hypothetical protein [unclassified Leisingera]
MAPQPSPRAPVQQSFRKALMQGLSSAEYGFVLPIAALGAATCCC